MFKSTLISLAILAISPLALADNCQAGLKYCGRSLMKKGNYYDQIDQALWAAGQKRDREFADETLFYCFGGSSGAIKFETHCNNGCHDNDWNRDDTCN